MRRWAALSFLVATALLWGLRPVSKHNQDQLVLGCYSAPRNLDHDYFQLLTELGFNHSLYWSSPRIDPEQWKSDLDRADKRNIHLIFNSGQPAAMPEEWLEAVLHTACSHPAFAGVYAPDEPGYRFPLESGERKPSLEGFRSAYRKMQQCGRGYIFHVDAAPSLVEERWVRQFLRYCTVFGLDIYAYKKGIDWRERTRRASRRAVELAAGRPVWMVLQGHGRADWYNYATQQLHLDIKAEDDPRPTTPVLLEMAEIALGAGADGLWWWSFELYDWKDPDHRQFILQFREVHRRLKLSTLERVCGGGLGGEVEE